MGAGIAKQVKDKWPALPKFFGDKVRNGGNHVYCALVSKGQYIVSFPTKHHWRDPSDLALIEQSAKELVVLTNDKGWQKVCLTRAGCGLGNLLWGDVKKVIAPILDDRFVVVSK
jgi:hypothetical protein